MTTMSWSYRNTAPGVLAAESAAERARRNGISPALATSREARAAAPVHASGTGTPPVGQPAIPPGSAPGMPPVPQVKGAVKVAEFPVKSMYPFDQIARDGGIWRIDPAAFTWRGKPVKITGVTTAARKWADSHGLTVKIVPDDGYVYVQFGKGGA